MAVYYKMTSVYNTYAILRAAPNGTSSPHTYNWLLAPTARQPPNVARQRLQEGTT